MIVQFEVCPNNTAFRSARFFQSLPSSDRGAYSIGFFAPFPTVLDNARRVLKPGESAQVIFADDFPASERDQVKRAFGALRETASQN